MRLDAGSEYNEHLLYILLYTAAVGGGSKSALITFEIGQTTKTRKGMTAQLVDLEWFLQSLLLAVLHKLLATDIAKRMKATHFDS